MWGRVTTASLLAFGLLAAPSALAQACKSEPRVIELTSGSHAGAWPEGFKALALGPKEVVLTFDDGPNPKSTPLILETLKANCLKAVFFPIGDVASEQHDLVKRELAEGHVVGGHTWDHALLTGMKLADAAADIDKGFAPLRADGVVPKFFRFPQLAASKELLAALDRKGLTAISADIDPSDWAGDPADQTLARLKEKLNEKGRGIVILHDSQPNTAKLLPGFLDYLRREGYSVVTLQPAMQRGAAN